MMALHGNGQINDSRCGSSRLRAGMGTFIVIDAEAASAAAAARAIDAAYAAIDAVERRMHPTRGGSDVAAINAAKPGSAVRVHPWTWEVLDLCKRVNHFSGGRFDPCLPHESGRLADIGLPAASVVSRRAPLMLDLGGIAKGFAIDQAIEAMREAGCTAGLVNAGGDLRVFGRRGHEIVCRDGPRRTRVVHLEDAALAASCAHQPHRTPEHRGHYCGVDRSPIASGSAAVVAPSAAIADALTKCLLAGANDADDELLEAFGASQVVRWLPGARPA